MSSGRRTRQREQTRSALLEQGRRLFAAKGYAGVGLAEIVGAAGVTKGALYHQFDGKTELFGAVHARIQQEVAAQVAAAAQRRHDPWEQLLAGCRAFLEASTAPAVQRIMLVDGPAVLGWREWRAVDEAASARHLADALESLIAAGTIAPQPVAPLTHLLSGAMNEAALWLADTAAPGDLDATWNALARMLESLRGQ
ncbi:TetR/AcrR family transcriptional regulator [Streptomonospora litoralis]|uniref:Transposon Tn10 TetC protein n=1 Tax=Streptomonospora litoralis TaxID=2498135 RepID=A0A4P6Q6B7_9ACTN|nr:TetR/AcrR family transcriptional regulator [Streptomonospora litoralis]QBI54337.1 Transposon Tn10 TetC protein [Streptomonospora litoralis]